MTAFLELVNGDINELQGRVIVYVRYNRQVEDGSNFEEDKVISVFCSTHPADFTEKFGAPEGGLADLEQRAVEVRAKQPDESSGVVPIYAAPVELELTDIQIAAHLYVMCYSEQLISRSGFQAEIPVVAEAEITPVTYKDISSDQMSDHLQMHFIAPIMHALEDDNLPEATAIAQNFIQFCGHEGPLTDDAYALAAVVKSAGRERRRILLYKYFEKILAITSQRFEDAARLRNEIKAMKVGKGI